MAIVCGTDLRHGEVQELMALVSILILCLKYIGCKAQHSPRTKKQCFYDGTKLLVGAGVGNMINQVLANGGTFLPDLPGKMDTCAWYTTGVILNCTIGVLYNYMVFSSMVSIVECQFVEKRCSGWKDFMYNLVKSERETSPGADEPKKKVTVSGFEFVGQLVFWMLVVVVSRFCVMFTERYLGRQAWWQEIMLRTLGPEPRDRPMVPVFILPPCLGFVQFFLQDEILAHSWLVGGHRSLIEPLIDEAGDHKEAAERAKEKVKRMRQKLIDAEKDRFDKLSEKFQEAQIPDPITQTIDGFQELSKEQRIEFWDHFNRAYANMAEKTKHNETVIAAKKQEVDRQLKEASADEKPRERKEKAKSGGCTIS